MIRGSVRSRSRRPSYAFVLLEDGEIVEETEVTLHRLLRRLAEERPEVLAVDSLQELAADQHEVYALLQAMPTGTRLVQVTGGERTESLAQVAGRYNIRFNRLNPYDEARTIARVAALGAGAEVIAFENTTEVAVTRSRSPGRGGWSQNRYVRKIHGAVQRKAREIEAELAAAGVRVHEAGDPGLRRVEPGRLHPAAGPERRPGLDLSRGRRPGADHGQAARADPVPARDGQAAVPDRRDRPGHDDGVRGPRPGRQPARAPVEPATDHGRPGRGADPGGPAARGRLGRAPRCRSRSRRSGGPSRPWRTRRRPTSASRRSSRRRDRTRTPTTTSATP